VCTLNIKARGFQPGGEKKSWQGGLKFQKSEYKFGILPKNAVFAIKMIIFFANNG
jgi:hypothetical protein